MTKKVVIKDMKGLHASLSAEIVRCASQYTSDIYLHYGKNVIDIKSILGLLSLAIPQGVEVELEANGQDAELALNDIARVLGN